jgi:hypothetical protein
MATQLRQRHRMSSVTYTLEYNGVRVDEQGFNKNFSSFIRFEEIQPTPFFLRVFHKAAIVFSMFCGAWLLVYLVGFFSDMPFNPVNYPIMLGLMMVPTLTLWFSRTEVTGYGLPGNGLIITAHKPSRAEVQSFLQAVQEARVRYLRDVYLEHAPPVTPEEELRRLIWLKDVGVISAEELEARRGALFPAPAAGGMGFHART